MINNSKQVLGDGPISQQSALATNQTISQVQGLVLQSSLQSTKPTHLEYPNIQSSGQQLAVSVHQNIIIKLRPNQSVARFDGKQLRLVQKSVTPVNLRNVPSSSSSVSYVTIGINKMTSGQAVQNSAAVKTCASNHSASTSSDNNMSYLPSSSNTSRNINRSVNSTLPIKVQQSSSLQSLDLTQEKSEYNISSAGTRSNTASVKQDFRPKNYVTSTNSANSQAVISIKEKKTKRCNCTRSQCLKLYCECFAIGEFCNDCNCVNCHNNNIHTKARNTAIEAVIAKNPFAFNSKLEQICQIYLTDLYKKECKQLSNRLNNKGCNCKRSGCLKNYCECYEAKIKCSKLCKCLGCYNMEETRVIEEQPDDNYSTVIEEPINYAAIENVIDSDSTDSLTNNHVDSSKYQQHHSHSPDVSTNPATPVLSSEVSDPTNARSSLKIITEEVLEAVCTCLIAELDESQYVNISYEYVEKQILIEFGRCLGDIVEMWRQSINLRIEGDIDEQEEVK